VHKIVVEKSEGKGPSWRACRS